MGIVFSLCGEITQMIYRFRFICCNCTTTTSRYDFIADINGRLIKIQCKISSEVIDNGKVVAILFKTVRSSGSNSKICTHTKYTKEEIDYFATFYKNQCYVVPVEQCSNEKRLRFIPPKNGQIKGINWAKDYELKEVYNKL